MKVRINSSSAGKVVSVGIQGPAGAPAINNIITATDVDASTLEDGSILVYKTATNKWTSTTTLDAQDMEGGEF